MRLPIMPDSTPPPEVAHHTQARRRAHIGLWLLGTVGLAVVVLILLWNWDWFIPLIDARASAALGRPVAIQHLHVRLGRTTIITADGVTVANPANFPQPDPLAHVDHLTIAADIMAYIHGQGIVLPDIGIDHPHVVATALPNGSNNFTFAFPAPAPNAKPGPPQRIGALRITGGTARVAYPKLRTLLVLNVETREAANGAPAAIVVTGTGSYAGQPVSEKFVGGALLTLRDAAHPYPIDLHIENGGTLVSLVGTVQNPLAFAGANLKLTVTGADMANLYPLTGIPIPPTPPYSISGNLDYLRPKIRFTDFAGRVGSSDLHGSIAEDPGIGGKPDVTMELWSHRVDLADLGGFIGTPPGKKSTPGQTPAQERALSKAEAKKTLLPDTPINMPKLRAADIHLSYRGDHIENRFTPFDDIAIKLDIVDGHVSIHPLELAVGRGHVLGNIDLAPGAHDILHTNADVAFQHIDLARIMAATHTFKGQGTIAGELRIDTNGNSLASMMGQGNGEAKLILLGGGNLSALLVDLSGLEFGNALLSALGVPDRAQIQCFVTDMPLQNGVLSTKVLLLDTGEGRITGDGTIDFRSQTLDYELTTRAKHFSVGSLPGPIHITGPLGDPSIRPGAETIARAGAATGLGILLTPLGALLPTIQFGIGNDNACTRATVEERQPLHIASQPRRRVHR